MKFSRRSFLAGFAAATAAAVVPKGRAEAALSEDSYATLIDLTKCDGCEGKGTPKCILACRDASAHKFPEPDKSKIKDYWPQKFHEDWSEKRDVTDRLTPYNWIFVQQVAIEVDRESDSVSLLLRDGILRQKAGNSSIPGSGYRILLPDPDAPLKAGDRLLVCGDRAAFRRMRWTVSHRHTLDYVMTGEDRPQSWIWRKLTRRNHYKHQ